MNWIEPRPSALGRTGCTWTVTLLSMMNPSKSSHAHPYLLYSACKPNVRAVHEAYIWTFLKWWLITVDCKVVETHAFNSSRLSDVNVPPLRWMAAAFLVLNTQVIYVQHNTGITRTQVDWKQQVRVSGVVHGTSGYRCVFIWTQYNLFGAIV